MQDPEHRRIGANAQREREQRNGREAGRSEQRPARMAHVTSRIVQPPERAGITVLLLGLVDAPESPLRSEPGVLVGQAALSELVFEERQVRVHFARQVALGPFRA